MSAFTPGSYRVTRDVAPLIPDKRKRYDWRARKLEAGSMVHIEWERFPGPDGHPDNKWLKVWAGRWSHEALRLDDDAVLPLLEAIEPLPDTPRRWMLRNGHESSALHVLDQLAKGGLITLEQVQSAYEQEGET